MTQKNGTMVSATVGQGIVILCSTLCTDERVGSDKDHHEKARKWSWNEISSIECLLQYTGTTCAIVEVVGTSNTSYSRCCYCTTSSS
jgi:hypothetical protein